MEIVTRMYHVDPGHGWLEVPEAEVLELGIRVSGYSYRKGDILFLEEDCDGPAYIKAQADRGVKVMTRIINYDQEAPIRNYDRA